MILLTVDSPSPRAGQTVTASVDPAGCSIDEQWAGELIVRTSGGDTTTGSRLEIGAASVSVDLPPDLTGPALLMLEPDQDCEQAGAPGDCHYPYVEVQISPWPRAEWTQPSSGVRASTTLGSPHCVTRLARHPTRPSPDEQSQRRDPLDDEVVIIR